LKRTTVIPLQTTLIYIVVAANWIYFSDYFLASLNLPSDVEDVMQTYKGWFFVLMTGILLYFFIQNRIRSLERERAVRKQAEELLREKETVYGLVFTNIGEAVLLTEPSGSIVSVNPAACAMFGRTEEELCGVRRDDLVDVNDPGVIAALSERERTQSFRGELSFIRKDGSCFPAWVTSSMFLDARGVQRTSLIIHDLTEQKKEEERIRRFNAELEERVLQRTAALHESYADLESFSYSVSHDLRAPLRAIDSFTGILVQDHQAHFDDDARRLMASIRSNTKKMDQLINGLLSIARVGKQELVYEHVDMKQMVESVCDEVLLDADRSRISIAVQDLPSSWSDPVLIRQVWVNLLSNAVKYSSKVPRAEIAVGFRDRDSEMEYFVADNGAGFSPDHASKLFGIFQRLHPAEQFEGVGVGLSTVQRIVKRFGGKVQAVGIPGNGATFSFTLPKVHAETPAS
jgi:PAS domain S-box-containing protein